MADDITKHAADLIRELTDASQAVGTVEGGNTPYLLHRQDYKVTTLEGCIQNDRSERPVRIKQAVEVWDTDSFTEYFMRFRDSNSRVFADISAATVMAILDYHESRLSAEGIESDAAAPRWGSHRLTLLLKKSPEWLLWANDEKHGGNNRKTMDQDTFATFIEDNNPDIVEPTAATMKEIASDLHETHEMVYAGTTKGANGSQKLTYTQENKSTFGKSDASVPESFRVAIPVYVGGSMVSLVARLRWRVSGGKATFWYDLLRADAAERAAFDAARVEISTACKVPVLNGKI